MANATPLKIEIIKKGLLIKDVSEKSGVNMNYLSMACNGRISLKPEHQKAIANVLNRSVSKLFPKRQA